MTYNSFDNPGLVKVLSFLQSHNTEYLRPQDYFISTAPFGKRTRFLYLTTKDSHMPFTYEFIMDNAYGGIHKKDLKTVRDLEDYIDDFQLEITSYLSALSRKTLSDEVSTELPVLLHAVNDLERIGDHAVNIVEIAERKIEHKLSFSEPAVAEAEQLRSEVEEMFDHVIEALDSGDTIGAKMSQEHEYTLNEMQISFRRSHVERMSEGICTPETGLIFIDLVDNVEKIGDHLTNIAQAIIGGLQWEGVKPKISTDS